MLSLKNGWVVKTRTLTSLHQICNIVVFPCSLLVMSRPFSVLNVNVCLRSSPGGRPPSSSWVFSRQRCTSRLFKISHMGSLSWGWVVANLTTAAFSPCSAIRMQLALEERGKGHRWATLCIRRPSCVESDEVQIPPHLQYCLLILLCPGSFSVQWNKPCSGLQTNCLSPIWCLICDCQTITSFWRFKRQLPLMCIRKTFHEMFLSNTVGWTFNVAF